MMHFMPLLSAFLMLTSLHTLSATSENDIEPAFGKYAPKSSSNWKTAKAGGSYVIDRVDIFSPGDINLLEGIGMLFGLGAGDITSILSLVKVGLGVVDFVDKVFSKVFNGSSISLEFNPGSDRELLAMYEVLTYRLDEIHMGVQGIESSLRTLTRSLPFLLRWEVALDSLEDYTRPVNSLYDRFTLYQQHRDEVEKHTLRDFAENVVSHGAQSTQSLLASIHSMVAPDAPSLPQPQVLQALGPEYATVNSRVSHQYEVRYKQSLLRKEQETRAVRLSSDGAVHTEMSELSLRPSVFVLLQDVLQEADQCWLQQTPQQLVMGLYWLVAVTQARGYAMISYSYMLLKMYGQGNFTVEQELSRTLYEHYGRQTMKQALKAVKGSSNTFTRCEPQEHMLGETYVMFTELLQGHIENEVDLSPRGSCINKCDSYDHTRVHGCYMPDKQLCGRAKPCRGTMHHCRFYDADADVCFSSQPHRRYDWIRYEDGRALGPAHNSDTCPSLLKVDSWWRWFVHCSYCMCLCDDPSSNTTDRYVSLEPVLAKQEEGMILTGLKFSKHRRVVTLEGQHGRAMPQGQVDPGSLDWIPVPDFDVERPSASGVQYHTLTYEAREMDLDDLRAPPDHVVTGVRFRLLGLHLNLEVRVTPVNFTSGELSANLSYWMSNDNTPVMTTTPRRQLLLDSPGDPVKSDGSSVRTKETHDLFVQFEATNFDSDAAQMTVPYFDAQPVTPSPPTWLSGVGVYHRGPRGSGGFVALEVYGYNATKHFQDAE